MDVLSASDPEEVVAQVRELQVSMLDEEAEALEEMGLSDAEEAKSVLRRVFERLQTLRRSNQALERAQEATGAEDPDELVEQVEALRERADAYDAWENQLAEAGFDRPDHALEALTSMEEQLQELYEEKEATEQTEEETGLRVEGDTFEQLQSLLAREEKLQRGLGVSNPDAVIEMVEGLSEQLNELYQDRDVDTESSGDSIFSPAEPTPAERSLEEEFGVSDPEALSAMMEGLTEQLDVLYSGRERLAELDLEGVDDAVEMVQTMQDQLESMYERREEMSEHGVNGIDQALSMIDSMEEQLSEIYDERQQLANEQGIPDPEAAASRLEELQAELKALVDEKKALREKRNHLQAQLTELQDELGIDDTEAIPELVQSMEAQLQEAYAEREAGTPSPSNGSTGHGESLLPSDTLDLLDEKNDDALNDLPVGLLGLDANGIIRRTNQRALQWPDVTADDSSALIGMNFFQDVAPGANNTLFRGRFNDGVDAGEIDEQFTYTYVSDVAPPTNLSVHLFSRPTQPTYWIVFGVLERY